MNKFDSLFEPQQQTKEQESNTFNAEKLVSALRKNLAKAPATEQDE